MKGVSDIVDMVNARRKRRNLPPVDQRWVHRMWNTHCREQFPSFPKQHLRSKLWWNDTAANRIVGKIWSKTAWGQDPEIERKASFYHQLFYG